MCHGLGPRSQSRGVGQANVYRYNMSKQRATLLVLLVLGCRPRGAQWIPRHSDSFNWIPRHSNFGAPRSHVIPIDATGWEGFSPA